MEDRRMQMEEIVGVSEPFNLTEDDSEALIKYSRQYQPVRGSWVNGIPTVLEIVSVAVFLGMIKFDLISQEIGFVALCAFFVGHFSHSLFEFVAGVVYHVILGGPSEKERKRDRWKNEPSQVKLTVNGVSNGSGACFTFYRWDLVAEIVETDRYLFLWVAANTVILVPRRAFSSDPMFRIFVEQAFRLRDEFRKPDAEKPSLPNTDITPNKPS